MATEQTQGLSGDELAAEGLRRHYAEVADARFEGAERGGSGMQNGLAETYEQVTDDYFSGGNEATFVRDGEDLGKTDGYEPT